MAKKQEETCPNCGYCPHCGRSNQPVFVNPYWVPYPWYPQYPWPYYPNWVVNPTVTIGGSSAGSSGISFSNLENIEFSYT